MRRLIFVFCLWFTLSRTVGAGPDAGEADSYAGAAKAFQDGFFSKSEKEMGEFAAKFPQSPRLAESVLLRAESLYQLRRFDAAEELLNAAFGKAGAWSDQYVFWMGECENERGNYPAADRFYAQLLKDFPQSPLRLDASYRQALARFRLRDLAAAIDLLRARAGDFQKASQNNPEDPVASRGILLLAEALLGQGQLGPAREALARLSARKLKPELDWERADLQARVELAGTAPEGALGLITNAVAAAQAVRNFGLLARSFSLEAEVYKKLGQPARAVAAYEKINAAEGMPSDQRRLAVFKEADLLVSQSLVTNGIVRLEQFLAQNPEDAAADLIHLKAGELFLQQFKAALNPPPGTTPAVFTNYLQQARAHFDFVITRLTNSLHLGKAYMDRGWSLWEEAAATGPLGKMAESQAAFQAAAERLPHTEEQALARLKWADAQLYQKLYSAAVTNYQFLIKTCEDIPQARTNLFDQAFHQILRANLESKNLPEAQKTLAEMAARFPESPHTQQSYLLFGQALADQKKTDQARSVFADFLSRFPKSALIPEVKLANARIFSQEQKWSAAIAEYDEWVTNYFSHPARAQAEFDRAWVYDQAGKETNAYRLFTNFVAQFPVHSLAPVAQNWVADYFRGQENWTLAEQNYQKIFQNTNWPVREITYQARLMASKTAYFRQGYADARGYLTNLISDPGCPPELLPEAWFVFGDVLIEQRIAGSTNTLQNFGEAYNAFDRITSQFPTNRLAPLAWGKKGDCYFQLATAFPKNYEDAEAAYKKVLGWKETEVPIAALSQAKVGLALVWEKQALAEGRSPAEKNALLNKALDSLLDVVYGKTWAGKPPDPFWVKRAGLSAGRIAEALNQKTAAIELYRRLIRDLPGMRTIWESKIQSLQAAPPG